MTLYSHSRISTFEQCTLKFKFAYIDKVKTEVETTVEAFLGSMVHTALEKLYKDIKFEKLLELKELLDYYNVEWKENWNDAIVIVREQYSQENYRKMGERFLADYYRRYHPFNQTRTIALETEDTVPLDDKGQHNIHVRIDRLSLADDNTYEIHDYKTSNTLPTQDEVDEDRQLAIYAYGVKKMYPDAHKIRLVWHYLAFDKEMSSERTDDELEALRKDVLKAVLKIEACEEYAPKESALCKWCQFQIICPNFKHLYEIEHEGLKKYIADDGVKLVNEYSKVQQEIKHKEEELEKLRDALVGYAKQHNVNVVFGSDVKARVNTYPSMKFPGKTDVNRDRFIEMIKKIGLYDRLGWVDTYELAKMINNGEIPEELIALLEPFIRREEITRIYLGNK